MNRPKLMDPLQGFMNSFKQFEKKLSKLQDDVSFHGNTLNELRTMVANLAISVSNDSHTKKPEEKPPQHKRTVGVQYEVYFLQHRRRRGDLMDSRNLHLKPKITIHQKLCKAPEVMPKQKINSVMNSKHKRQIKVDSHKRANTLRAQKNVDKKRKRK